jgi:hypothetical protein
MSAPQKLVVSPLSGSMELGQQWTTLGVFILLLVYCFLIIGATRLVMQIF